MKDGRYTAVGEHSESVMLFFRNFLFLVEEMKRAREFLLIAVIGGNRRTNYCY
jgi:hypothetical protein